MEHFAWENIGRLRMLSYFQLLVVAPFFLGWTMHGSNMFIKINADFCEEVYNSQDTVAFLIFWFSLTHILILCFICLLVSGLSFA